MLRSSEAEPRLDEARRFNLIDAQRVRVWTLASSVAMNFPRRLGRGVTRQELAYDKKISRKTCHIYYQLWLMLFQDGIMMAPPAWGEWQLAYDDEMVKRVGATVMWDERIDSLINTVNTRIDMIDDFDSAPRRTNVYRWYNQHRLRLHWELNQLERLQRDIVARRPAA